MMTLTTIVFDKIRPFADTLIKSTTELCPLVNEIICVEPEITKETSEKIGGVLVRHVPGDLSLRNLGWDYTPKMYCIDHALNHHKGIDAASNDLVVISDADVFFLSDACCTYLNLMEDHHLDFVGISHHQAVDQSYHFFPCVVNCLVRKSRLPDPSFLEDRLTNFPLTKDTTMPFRGKYLITENDVDILKDIKAEYAKSDGYYETGCLLYLWAVRNNWRWLSFQTSDMRLYTTKYQHNNFKFRGKLPFFKLLYHQIGSSKNFKATAADFMKKYELK